MSANGQAKPCTVWAVFASEAIHNVAGYLVSDSARLPRLIAFVEGHDQASMTTAMLIATCKRSPESAGSIDLRGREVPDFLINRPLIPLDAGDGIVVGAFTRSKVKGVTVFSVMDRPGLREWAGKFSTMPEAENANKSE